VNTDPDLRTLLSKIALKDRAAFEGLYRATAAHLLSVAYRVLNNRDRAEEVLQEAYMNVWHSAQGYQAGLATPMTWLINIVRNKAIDARRSGQSERAARAEFDDSALDVAADAELEPQRLLEQGMSQARIDTCMATLTAPQRQALALAYYRGMAHTEVAAVLGAPLGTAKAWVRRGLDKLEECLRNAGVVS
jgi:RNA polymerase sigma-70 factor, ECF subfamily